MHSAVFVLRRNEWIFACFIIFPLWMLLYNEDQKIEFYLCLELIWRLGMVNTHGQNWINIGTRKYQGIPFFKTMLLSPLDGSGTKTLIDKDNTCSNSSVLLWSAGLMKLCQCLAIIQAFECMLFEISITLTNWALTQFPPCFVMNNTWQIYRFIKNNVL